MFDSAKQNAFGVQLSRGRACGVLYGGADVLTCRAVALQLAADGAGQALEQARHGTNAVALLVQAGEGGAVFRLELGVVSKSKATLVDLTGGRCCTSVLNLPCFCYLARS